MSEDHTETMGGMFDRGLKLRREVLGAEYGGSAPSCYLALIARASRKTRYQLPPSADFKVPLPQEVSQ